MKQEGFLDMLVKMDPTKRAKYKKLLFKLFRKAEVLNGEIKPYAQNRDRLQIVNGGLS